MALDVRARCAVSTKGIAHRKSTDPKPVEPPRRVSIGKETSAVAWCYLCEHEHVWAEPCAAIEALRNKEGRH